MPTQHIRRLLMVVPAAQASAYNTWLANNLDVPGVTWGETFSVGYSATGIAPATHFVTCAAMTDEQFRKVFVRLCFQAGITFPVGWAGMTRDEKRDWARAQIVAIRIALGVRLLIDDNDGQWDDYAARLEAAGLKPVDNDAIAPSFMARALAAVRGAVSQPRQPVSRRWVVLTALSAAAEAAVIVWLWAQR